MSLELDRWIERVWNRTGETSKSGTGRVDRVSLERIEQVWNWTGGSNESE